MAVKAVARVLQERPLDAVLFVTVHKGIAPRGRSYKSRNRGLCRD